MNFPVEGGVDSTIQPKTVVYGVEIGGTTKAYPEDILKVSGVIDDNIGGVDVEVDYNNSNIKVVRLDTSEEIPATRLFWFAWIAFKPDTELYSEDI